jgi:NDP-hexose C3-ketoreductase / dTDP-4-oxo-2-deoxy-alpha-D-pentos-2-ene 2,3-reductase
MSNIKCKALGLAGPEISCIGLGTMNLGEKANEKQSHEILSRALNCGITFIDTANVYGRRIGSPGLSESIIGNWLQMYSGRRNKIILGTKMYAQMNADTDSKGLRASHIVSSCEASLRRLRTDRIDLYQFHHYDPDANWDEIWEATALLHQQGKVLHFGSSNFPGWEIAKSSEFAARAGINGLVSEQTFYNPLERIAELEVFPACKHYGVGIIAYSPLCRGLLRGNTRDNQTGQLEKEDVVVAFHFHRERINAFETLADKFNTPASTLAIRWLTEKDELSSVLIGPRNILQLDECLLSQTIPWTKEMQNEIDDVMRPNYGRPDKKLHSAPEAYAW